jgi:hypothetical protein
VKAHPRLAYQLFFDKQTSAATDELDRDVRRTLRGTLRDVASPPPESFLMSPDTFIGAWDGVDEVRFSMSRVPVTTCLLTCTFRFLPSRSSRKRKRIIGLSSTALVVSNTVSVLSPFTYSVTNISAVAALQFYTEEVLFIALMSRYHFSHAILQNHFASWKFANEQGNHTIYQPILSILPTEVCTQGHQKRNFR